MPNPVVHFEVTGKDGKKLQDFYGGIFGWNVDADNPMNYGIVSNEDTGGGIGGGMVILAQFADPEGNVIGLVKAGYPG
jgi:predicted enzyme related to lactoylglutathione lyase